MAEFRMPSLGADMEAGTLVAWRAKVGDTLRRGEIIAEVETEKGIIEVEVFTPGVVERLLVEPGTKVPVGTALAILREGNGAPSPDAAPHVDAAQPRISPAARRRAQELGVDPRALHGSGPEGAITLRDVENASKPAAPAGAEAPPPTTTAAPAAASGDRQRAMRRAIAAAMARSKREIPHYYVQTTIDVSTALAWLSARNAERSVRERILPAVLLLKATALAARRAPQLNAYFEAGELRRLDHLHLGVAISLREGGLIAPAIHDADRLSLDRLMAKLQDLVMRARAGTLRSSELSDATITVTNLGERGVEAVYPIIYPPQTAIVGFGRIAERPWVVDGALAVRPLLHATLAADHRVTDGHLGARFLAHVDALLQKPGEL